MTRAQEERRSGEPASVRPPDLDTVRARPIDVLAGWDVDGDAPARLERPPFPLDTVVVGGAAVLGGLVGALGAGRRGRRVVAGAVAGAVIAGVVRRIWRAP